MKANTQTLIIALSIAIAATGLSAAAMATRQKKLAQAEAQALRQQLAELQARALRSRATTPPAPDQTDREAIGKTNALATSQGSPAEAEADGQQERPQRESFTDRIARMKEEDPKGYAEMTKRRDEMQQAIKYDVAKRMATIMDFNTTNMGDSEREAHEQLVSKMGRVWELMEQMQNPEEGNMRETMGELFIQIQQARPLMDQERATMFKILGTDLGYEGQVAEDFAAHIEDIINATTIQMPRGVGGR
jgi:type IV secretory pathway VirB10-like protein